MCRLKLNPPKQRSPSPILPNALELLFSHHLPALCLRFSLAHQHLLAAQAPFLCSCRQKQLQFPSDGHLQQTPSHQSSVPNVCPEAASGAEGEVTLRAATSLLTDAGWEALGNEGNASDKYTGLPLTLCPVTKRHYDSTYLSQKV